MDCDMDVVSHVDGLSHAAEPYNCAIDPDIYSHADARTRHADSYANTNRYTGSFANIHPGTAGLPQAAGGLYAPRN